MRNDLNVFRTYTNALAHYIWYRIRVYKAAKKGKNERKCFKIEVFLKFLAIKCNKEVHCDELG